jgi:hypothetical protein
MTKTRKARLSASATTRKAPSDHASDMELGSVMEKDGTIWIVEATGKSKRWNKASGYFTHDNGGRPFYVKIRDGRIDVFKRTCTEKCMDTQHMLGIYKHIYTIPHSKNVWIGINKGKYANSHGSEAKGNSIFVHIGGTKYVIISDHISEFTIKDEITEFHGIVGNSDTTFPIAIGKKNIYYFMEDTYFPVSEVPSNTILEYYYDNWKKAHKIPRKMIQKRVI